MCSLFRALSFRKFLKEREKKTPSTTIKLFHFFSPIWLMVLEPCIHVHVFEAMLYLHKSFSSPFSYLFQFLRNGSRVIPSFSASYPQPPNNQKLPLRPIHEAALYRAPGMVEELPTSRFPKDPENHDQ
jgi:hypothetical protein